MVQDMARTGATASSTRQTFSGRDDLILLRLVESVAPWSHRGGVMDAWSQIAKAMNADMNSTLSGLSPATTRARFFRMVTQRRERQDKMLRRGTASDQEYQAKLEQLDKVIKQLNTFEQEASFTTILNEISDEHDGKQAATVVAPPIVAAAPIVQVPAASSLVKKTTQQNVNIIQATTPTSYFKKPKQDAKPAPPVISAPPVRPSPLNTIERSPVAPTLVKPSATTLQQRAVVNSVQAVQNQPAQPKAAAVPPLALQNDTSGSGNFGWFKVADRALALFNSRLELDRETAIAERQYRQEEARVRAQELSIAREQTKQLVDAVLSMARAASKH